VNDRASRIEAQLRETLAPQLIEIQDDSSRHAGHAGAREGGHFTVTIVSPRFAGLTPVQRHRLVYESLGDLMKTDIHALQLRALAPGEK
jgi:BolA protein